MANVKGVRLGPYSLNLSSTGIVITDRISMRHMTVCYNIFRNAIDIHVKCDKTGVKIVGKLLPITEVVKYFDTVSSKLEQLIVQLQKSVIKITPGWLKKRGYYILRYSESDLKKILMSSISVKRQKYVFDTISIRKNFRNIHRKKDYSPFSLFRIDHEDAALIHAVKIDSNSSKFRLLIFNLGKPREWYAIRFSKIERLLEGIIDPAIAKKVEKVLDEVFAEFNVDGVANEVNEMLVLR